MAMTPALAQDQTNADFSDFGRRIRRAYITALCLIGILSIAAFVALNGFIAQQGEAASVINVAGKQRMLSQRIAGLSRAIAAATDAKALQRDKSLLNRAASDMAAAHESLVQGSVARNLPGIQSAAENAYYFDRPHNVDAKVQTFVADAQALLEETEKNRQETLARRIADMARIDLLGALNAVVKFHEDQARGNASRAETIHLGLLLATLATLFGEALFIFSPLARELISREMVVREKQTELTYKSFHDQLTGLFNRRYLRSHAEFLTQGSPGETGEPYSLIAIDIDNFKDVNDANGHETGDRLLRVVGEIVRTSMRACDLAFRIGGDEFLIVISSADPNVAEHIAGRLRASIQSALSREPGCSAVAASFGIASAPANGGSFNEVLANADIALYHAKSTGKNTVAVFHEPLRAAFEGRRKAEVFVRAALEASAFEPFFQPQVDMRTGQIVGVEALARCRDAEGAIVPPSQFLPIAEETGLIVPLGEQIIAKAIRSAQRWLSEGTAFGRLSVNASSAQLRDKGFVAFLASTLAENGFPGERLSIEILETVLLDDGNVIVEIVEAIQDLGISVELDDFGTGYTSIANVNRLKVDRIKIDRSFIDGVGTVDSSMHVLKAILTMAQSLNVDVIAEGIETHLQQEQLIALGCPNGQGFRFARPMDVDAMHAWLNEAVEFGSQARRWS